MPEHLSNGQFASKEVTQESGSQTATVAKGSTPHRFKKGDPKPPNSGRRKGTPNKLTRDVKEFLGLLVNKVSVQDAVEARIEKGDAVAFFRALEHVLGKPKENEGQPQQHEVVFRWQK